MDYRHEWKISLDPGDLFVLRQRLRAVMQPDAHAVDGRYRIRSLYFDTPEDRALREKLDGVSRREKFRIRYYNGDTGFIQLEKKCKRGGLGWKEQTQLTERQARDIAAGRFDAVDPGGDALLGQLCRKARTERLRAKTIVDYTREPFVYGPGNVRVTLDEDIRTGLSCVDFLDPDCVTVPAPDARPLMEVKWDAFLPDSFLENVTAVSLPDMLIALALSFGVGLFIFLIYKKTYQGVMYSSGFGVALLALTMITTLVILAVTSNVVLSLGMVGALSIVRFRTAIKEPLDLAFLFWSIAAGIVLAAGFIPLAVIGSAIIGVILLLFVNRKSHVNPYILVLQCADSATEATAKAYLETKTQRCVLKSKAVQAGNIEVNLELRLKSDNTDFINELSAMDGVTSAALVSYNGDYMG